MNNRSTGQNPRHGSVQPNDVVMCTEEERKSMSNCFSDCRTYRAIPGMLIPGAITYFLTKSAMKALGVSGLGMVLTTFSCIGTCKRSFLEKFPDSELARRMQGKTRLDDGESLGFSTAALKKKQEEKGNITSGLGQYSFGVATRRDKDSQVFDSNRAPTSTLGEADYPGSSFSDMTFQSDSFPKSTDDDWKGQNESRDSFSENIKERKVPQYSFGARNQWNQSGSSERDNSSQPSAATLKKKVNKYGDVDFD